MMSKQLGTVAASVGSEIIMDRNDKNSHNAYTACDKKSRNGSRTLGSRKNNLLFLLVLLMVQLCGQQVQAGWGNGKSNGDTDYSIYGNSGTRDWLYDGSTLSFQVLGCVWGVVEDSEEAGCLEDESEDGTYNWYMMANCRRPQVAYSVYSSGSSSCSSSTFVGSVSSLSVLCYRRTANLMGVGGYFCFYAVPNSIH